MHKGMTMKLNGPISRNGYILRVGDWIKFVGPKPPNPCVYYADEMEEMLNRGGRCQITSINRMTSDYKYSFTVNAKGWNWDLRNVEKYFDGDPPPPDVVIPLSESTMKGEYNFEIDKLDI
jgi:hypothetical protein